MRELALRRYGLPVCLAVATAAAAVAIGLWAYEGTRPVHAAAVLGGYASTPAKPSAQQTPVQAPPTSAVPSPAAPSPSASPSHSSGFGAARHRTGQHGGTRSTGADSAAAIKAKAEQLTGGIGKSKLTVTTPTPAAPPTSINVGG